MRRPWVLYGVMLAGLGAMLGMTGCASQQFITQQPRPEHTHQIEQQQVFLLGGLRQDKTVDAAALCGGADRVVQVDTRQREMDVVLATLTMGLYTPRRVVITCAGEGS